MSTNKAIIAEYRMANPLLTLAEIGRHFNLTRERIRQILSELGSSTAQAGWGDKTKIMKSCPICGEKKNWGSKYCAKCRYQVNRQSFICSYCSNTFQVINNLAERKKRKYKLHFCSKKCQGKWLAKNYVSKNIIIDK